MAKELAFESDVDRATDEPAFRVDLDGFEGPLDLLLELARRQKVDLSRISILALADQYIAFVEDARRVRLELAADYLVMAAWLAYLKSRLLLPEPPRAEEPGAAELADALARRLRMLEQIRAAAVKLMDRARLGRDVFERGAPEAIEAAKRPNFQATLYDLLAAYARQRQKQAGSTVRLNVRVVWSLADARAALERMIGVAVDWMDLDSFLVAYCADPKALRTARASSFSASLEYVREGKIELRQDRAFAPLYVRARAVARPAVA